LVAIFETRPQTTGGTDFWLTFGKNADNTFNMVNLQIRIVGGDQAGDFSVAYNALGYTESFPIAASEIKTLILTPELKQAVYNDYTTTTVTDFSIHITSTVPVVVYALNKAQASTDASNILPVTALGTEYYNISYTPYASYLDAYSVIATENNTNIYHNGGAPVATLNAGQVYYRTSSTDMTGAHITTDKPVAFFAQCQSAQIPAGIISNDCLFQQLAPVRTWERDFFVPVSDPRFDQAEYVRERVRIVVSQNNTKITPIGGVIKSAWGSQMSLDNLQAGQFVELETTTDNIGCYIQADKPIGVCTYLTGYFYNNTGLADPAQAWIPAIAQMIPEVRIAPFSGITNLFYHGFLIVTPTSSKNDTKISVNGGPFQFLTLNWYNNPNAGISYISLDVENNTGNYLIRNSGGLIVMGYGIGAAESYYYLAGSGMRDLDAMFYANDIHFQDLKDTAFCSGAVEFRAEIEGELHPDAGSLKWYVDGVEEVLAQDLLEWNRYFAAGAYEITMEVHYETGETVSKTGTLQIAACNYSAAFYANDGYYADLADTLFCVKHITFTTTIEGVGAMTSLKWYINNTLIPALEGEQTWEHLFGADNYIIKMEIAFNSGETQIYEGALSIGSIINIVPVTPDGGDTNINGGTPNTGGCFKVGTKIYFNAVPK
jgi:hypothetical protein